MSRLSRIVSRNYVLNPLVGQVLGTALHLQPNHDPYRVKAFLSFR